MLQKEERVKMGQPRHIYVGLGGNVGDTYALFVQALAHLEKLSLYVVRLSPVYKTAPVGGVEQADYLNAVAELETNLLPEAIQQLLQETENTFGRDRANEQRWGPRTLDIDYLLDEQASAIDSPRLTLPHPRMWERAFVVRPLADLRPDLHAADGQPIEQLAQALQAQQPIHRALIEKETPGFKKG